MCSIIFARKVLSFVIIAALLSMRLASLSEDMFAIPVQDAIFHIAFIAADEKPSSTKVLKVNAKYNLDILILPSDEITPATDPSQPGLIPAVCNLILKEVSAEIFIPPEVVS